MLLNTFLRICKQTRHVGILISIFQSLRNCIGIKIFAAKRSGILLNPFLRICKQTRHIGNRLQISLVDHLVEKLPVDVLAQQFCAIHHLVC